MGFMEVLSRCQIKLLYLSKPQARLKVKKIKSNGILTAVNHQCRNGYVSKDERKLSLVGALKQASRCIRLGAEKDVPPLG